MMSHPNYDDYTFDNDFMLLFLDEHVVGDDVGLVQVSPDFICEGKVVTAMGWGDTNRSNIKDYPSELREVEVTTLSNQKRAESQGYMFN